MLDKSEITKQTPEKSLWSRRSAPAAATPTAKSPSGIAAAATRSSIATWISAAKRWVSRPRWRPSSTTRTARRNIALLHYADGEKRYILHPVGLEVGATVSTGEGADILPGNAHAVPAHPAGHQVHNLELYPGKGAQVVRAAGGSAQLLSKEGDLALVKLPSGEVRKFAVDCMATVGQVGNLDHENETYGKAGRTRWHGSRPTVRGVAMNPVDHPHGGGEGRVKGNHPQTPWAFPTLGEEDAAQQAHRPADRAAPKARG